MPHGPPEHGGRQQWGILPLPGCVPRRFHRTLHPLRLSTRRDPILSFLFATLLKEGSQQPQTSRWQISHSCKYFLNERHQSCLMLDDSVMLGLYIDSTLHVKLWPHLTHSFSICLMLNINPSMLEQTDYMFSCHVKNNLLPTFPSIPPRLPLPLFCRK